MQNCLVVLDFHHLENNPDEKPPSCWYIINALGERIFVKKQKREAAQKIIDELYGKGKYTIRAAYTKSQVRRNYSVKASDR